MTTTATVPPSVPLAQIVRLPVAARNFGNHDNLFRSGEVPWPVDGRYESTTGRYRSGRRGGQRLWQLHVLVWSQDRPRQRQRPRVAGHLRPTDDDEDGTHTLLFGRKDPPRPLLSPPLLTTTSLCKAHGRKWWRQCAPPPPSPCCGEYDTLELRITVGKSVLFYSTIYILCRVAECNGGDREGSEK